MKVACLVASHNREKILDLCLKSLKQQTHPVDVYVVGEQLEEKIAKNNNCFFVYSENRPLSNKWQNGVNAIKEKNIYDALMIVGSDDLLSKKYVESSINHLSKFSLIGKSQWFVLKKEKNYKSERVNKLYELNYEMPKVLEPIGSGRIYSKTFLDKINWKLFYSGYNSLLDTHGFMKIFANREKFLITNNVIVKTFFDYTLSSFPFFLGIELKEIVDNWAFLKSFQEEEEAAILSIKDDQIECINSFEHIEIASKQEEKIRTLNIKQVNNDLEMWLENKFGEDLCAELLD